MTSLDKTYNPKEIEQQWYQNWETHHYFAPSNQGEPYCIMLPPPNVTGSLHMGHGFGFTLIDVLIRYERMCGKNTLWQTGTDHAGIATQMVVEKQLNRDGKTRHDLGREKFIERIWEWKKESGGNISRQLRRIGASIDWTRERFTLDDDLSYAVREVFIQLYQEGLIYRGERLVNWDPMLLTAISDLEVINEESDGHIWHIAYPLAHDKKQSIVVATTRPETLFGDVAVAVHPDDERYQKLIGKEVLLPLCERTIPIIADPCVDPLFGTGCLKITPAHDFNDYEVGSRHQLTPINVLTPTAHLNENVPKEFQGLERFKARTKVLEDLKTNNLLIKIEPHKLKIPKGEKSGVVIEPYLTKQWFMKMKPLAEPAIKAVENGDIRFIPDTWSKTYFQWMTNIEDWCISRQLWWGHRVPVWYDEEGKSYVGHDEHDVRTRNNLADNNKLTQDEDVLDTWFSSALWPFSSLGWPKQTPDYHTFFPTATLITGFDIIFFWVARMIMMSLKFTKQIPFRDIYITGLIRDAEGHKMSKSKGNVLDPIDLIDGIDLNDLIKKRTYGLMQPKMADKIEKMTKQEFPDGIPSFGTDALRFTFCSFASFTREIRFDINRLAGYRNFCNKLWNASRYVMMNTTDLNIHHATMDFSLPDRYIRSCLMKTIETAQGALSQYRFDLYAQTLYDFTWNEFCDWYLELSKPILTSNDSTEDQKQGARYTLITILEILLRLLHPIMPFITEELWQRVAPLSGKEGTSIMVQTYPQYDESIIDEKANQEIEWIKKIVTAIRTIRSEMNVSPSKSVPLLLRKGNKQDKINAENHSLLLIKLAKLSSINWLQPDENPSTSASSFISELELFLPMQDMINKEEEIIRLNKEILKLQKEFSQIDLKLHNPQFIEKAPPAVVAKEKAKQTELSDTLAKFKMRLSQLQSIQMK